jgi:hypothetical protein
LSGSNQKAPGFAGGFATELAAYNDNAGHNPAIVTYAVSLLSSELPQFIDARDHKNAWHDPLA